jgi:hypothetical protein
MKKAFLFLSIFMIVAAACNASGITASPTSPVPPPTNTSLPATVTPEVIPASTDDIPAEVQLNGVTLVVSEASFADCEPINCPPAAAGTRYLRVPLQGVNVPADQFLDYKNLPQGIAIRDNTGVTTLHNRIYAYVPATHELSLYFAVPENATVFGLQWPGAGEIPLMVVADKVPTTLPPSSEDVEVAVNALQMVIPPQLASAMYGNQVPRANGQDLPNWAKTPGHALFKLDGYVLKDRSHSPEIYVYPAQAYAQMVPAAFESIHRLNNILYPPGGPDLNNPLPAIPFFNEQQVFVSNIQLISFQNGQGVRFLTEYAQYAASANNHDLFYHFQGVTRDGTYYIVAILPVTAPMLAETSDAGAPLPDGGVPYPYFTDPNADMQSYYRSVTDLLNATPPEAFTPTINQLDLLIQSMRITQ